MRWHRRDTGSTPEHCTVICFFDEEKDGWDMRTVGERYVEALSLYPRATQIVSKYAFDFLMARHEADMAIADLNTHGGEASPPVFTDKTNFAVPVLADH